MPDAARFGGHFFNGGGWYMGSPEWKEDIDGKTGEI